MKNSSPLTEQQDKRQISAEATNSEKTVKLHSSAIVRGICVILAILCLILAVFGIVVPGIPTFDFLFLATVFASRGSARLHHWMHKNRFIRILLTQYSGGFKHISRPRKYILSLSILFGAVMLIIASIHPHIKLSLLVVLSMVLIWIWTRSEKK